MANEKTVILMDLIEREKVKAAIRDKFKTLHECTEINMIMNEQPAVDAAPVVHAHWVKHDNSCWSCSNCDETISMRRYMENKLRYCSWCGARMDKEDDEQNG